MKNLAENIIRVLVFKIIFKIIRVLFPTYFVKKGGNT